MSDLEILEKQDAPPVQKAFTRKKNWRWQWLIAPLMGISIILHIALLFVPLPSLEDAAEETVEAEEEPEVDEEAPIDILSLSEIEVPDPPPEPPPEQPQPQPESPPPPSTAVPPPPDPAAPVEEPLPEEEFFEEELPPEDGVEEPPQSSFDPARQQALLGQTGGINAEFDQTEYFPLYAWNPTGDNSPAYLGGWDPQRHNCFFSSIQEMDYQLDPRADRLKYLSRNYGLIVNQDLPRTFPGQAIVEVPGGYCGEALFEIQESAQPTGIYVSAIGIGPGDPPGSVLLIFWTSNPNL